MLATCVFKIVHHWRIISVLIPEIHFSVIAMYQGAGQGRAANVGQCHETLIFGGSNGMAVGAPGHDKLLPLASLLYVVIADGAKTAFVANCICPANARAKLST